MQRAKRNRMWGFTLIELLIVVAIIAILAAIAVPNFLEAQVRAKVSRVKNDMRALSTAIEAYRLDTNTYPNDQDNNPASTNENGFSRLTSPVAYITAIPRDPFNPPTESGKNNPGAFAPFYEMASGVDSEQRFGTQDGPNVQCYFIKSIGPDGQKDGANDHWPYNMNNVRFYDPTNGTRSRGDIYRFGGNYMSGNWQIMGVPWQEWGPIPVTVP